MAHSVGNAARVRESRDLGVKFPYNMYCMTWKTYLNFCAIVFSSVKWVELPVS